MMDMCHLIEKQAPHTLPNLVSSTAQPEQSEDEKKAWLRGKIARLNSSGLSHPLPEGQGPSTSGSLASRL